MQVKASFTRIQSRFTTVLMTGVAAFLLYSVPARADMIVSLESPINANAGTSGNGFDVLLTNSGPSAVSIAGFTFEISVSSTDIVLTNANTATLLNPYIFSGNSLFGPIITSANTGQDLSASDLSNALGSFTTLGAGTTLGLGHVLFDVSATAPSQTVPVIFAAFPATSLSDELANDVPIDALINGQININGVNGVVPEPSSLVLVLTAGALIWVGFRTRQLS
jgi:hypothetical protein